MATDPICGMYVDESTSSLVREREGRKYYFCSASCKLQFEKPEMEIKNLKASIAVAWPITIIVVLLTYILHFAYADYIMLVLAGIVQFYAGRRFYVGVSDAIKNRSANMDMLIAIGTSAAWAYSAAVTLAPGIFPTGGIYFDTSAMIVSLILTGTYMQRITESKAAGAISALVSMQPKIAHVVENGNIADIPLEKIEIGDLLLVKPGERIPTDSVVADGESSVDESMVTGESMPIAKGKGEKVIGGTVNLTGPLRINVERVGEDTILSQITRIVRDAASSKVPIQMLADKVASYFVPAVVIIGIFSAAAWYFVGNVGINTSILVFVSVLIIACPCALGIATPAALLVSSGRAAEQGILIKSGESIEKASAVDTLVIDKTGTLTNGRPEVTDIVPLEGYTEKGLLALAATAEISSEHLIGKAIVEKAKNMGIDMDFPQKFSYRQGVGISCIDKNGRSIIAGRVEMLGEGGRSMVDRVEMLENEGKTAVAIGVNGKAAGLIAVSDTLKEGSAKAIAAMKKAGYEIWLVTGDNNRAASAVAAELGIEHVVSEAKPEEKMEIISKMQGDGKVVAMIGDGVNDAPALTKADVGIAIGAGTEVAIQAGGIVLMRNSLYDALAALELGKRTMGKIRQNLFWAFAYNAVLIPVAAGALIPVFTVSIYKVLPMFAAVAMAFSSVTVVSNSLLLARFKAKDNLSPIQ